MHSLGEGKERTLIRSIAWSAQDLGKARKIMCSLGRRKERVLPNFAGSLKDRLGLSGLGRKIKRDQLDTVGSLGTQVRSWVEEREKGEDPT